MIHAPDATYAVGALGGVPPPTPAHARVDPRAIEPSESTTSDRASEDVPEVPTAPIVQLVENTAEQFEAVAAHSRADESAGARVDVFA